MNHKISGREILRADEKVLADHLRSEEYATQALVLIPGIRDWGGWTNIVKEQLKINNHIKVIPIRPNGWIDLLSFLLPPLHKYAEKSVSKQINALKNHNYYEISFIAHSFGSHCLVKYVKSGDINNISKIILCGSIVKDNIPWEEYINIHDRSKTPTIVNDCGYYDPWPIVARWLFPWKFGSVGRTGISHPYAENRYHNFGHGGFFNHNFIQKYWIPYITSKAIVPSNIRKKTDISLVTTFFTLPYFSLPILTVVALFFYFLCGSNIGWCIKVIFWN
ncbi:MAG: hypothetical protein ABW098_11240 [Candidatus Thiodiazotropha sp.]